MWTVQYREESHDEMVTFVGSVRLVDLMGKDAVVHKQNASQLHQIVKTLWHGKRKE